MNAHDNFSFFANTISKSSLGSIKFFLLNTKESTISTVLVILKIKITKNSILEILQIL